MSTRRIALRTEGQEMQINPEALLRSIFSDKLAQDRLAKRLKTHNSPAYANRTRAQLADSFCEWLAGIVKNNPTKKYAQQFKAGISGVYGNEQVLEMVERIAETMGLVTRPAEETRVMAAAAGVYAVPAEQGGTPELSAEETVPAPADAPQESGPEQSGPTGNVALSSDVAATAEMVDTEAKRQEMRSVMLNLAKSGSIGSLDFLRAVRPFEKELENAGQPLTFDDRFDLIQEVLLARGVTQSEFDHLVNDIKRKNATIPDSEKVGGATGRKKDDNILLLEGLVGYLDIVKSLEKKAPDSVPGRTPSDKRLPGNNRGGGGKNRNGRPTGRRVPGPVLTSENRTAGVAADARVTTAVGAEPSVSSGSEFTAMENGVATAASADVPVVGTEPSPAIVAAAEAPLPVEAEMPEPVRAYKENLERYCLNIEGSRAEVESAMERGQYFDTLNFMQRSLYDLFLITKDAPSEAANAQNDAGLKPVLENVEKIKSLFAEYRQRCREGLQQQEQQLLSDPAFYTGLLNREIVWFNMQQQALERNDLEAYAFLNSDEELRGFDLVRLASMPQPQDDTCRQVYENALAEVARRGAELFFRYMEIPGANWSVPTAEVVVLDKGDEWCKVEVTALQNGQAVLGENPAVGYMSHEAMRQLSTGEAEFHASMIKHSPEEFGVMAETAGNLADAALAPEVETPELAALRERAAEYGKKSEEYRAVIENFNQNRQQPVQAFLAFQRWTLALHEADRFVAAGSLPTGENTSLGQFIQILEADRTLLETYADFGPDFSRGLRKIKESLSRPMYDSDELRAVHQYRMELASLLNAAAEQGNVYECNYLSVLYAKGLEYEMQREVPADLMDDYDMQRLRERHAYEDFRNKYALLPGAEWYGNGFSVRVVTADGDIRRCELTVVEKPSDGSPLRQTTRTYTGNISVAVLQNLASGRAGIDEHVLSSLELVPVVSGGESTLSAVTENLVPVTASEFSGPVVAEPAPQAVHTENSEISGQPAVLEQGTPETSEMQDHASGGGSEAGEEQESSAEGEVLERVYETEDFREAFADMREEAWQQFMGHRKLTEESPNIAAAKTVFEGLWDFDADENKKLLLDQLRESGALE